MANGSNPEIKTAEFFGDFTASVAPTLTLGLFGDATLPTSPDREKIQDRELRRLSGSLSPGDLPNNLTTLLILYPPSRIAA